MSKSIEELLRLARVVKNEDQEGQNTATRIGGLFEDIVEKLKDYCLKTDVTTEPTEGNFDPVSSGGVYDAVQVINAKIEAVEQKIAHYHPEGITLTVPEKISAGVSNPISIRANCTTTAEVIRLYHIINGVSTQIHSVENNVELTYWESLVPNAGDTIAYKVVAIIDTETTLEDSKSVAVENPAPTPTNKTIYYGFAARDGKGDFEGMQSVEKGSGSDINVTSINTVVGNSFYVAVPSDMVVTAVYSGLLPVAMKTPVNHDVDGESYDFYETAEEFGFESGEYNLKISVNNI